MVSAAQQRLLNVMLSLAEQAEPAKLKELAGRHDVAPPVALRDLENLQAAGLAEQRPDGRWQPGPALLDIGKRIARSKIQHILADL